MQSAIYGSDAIVTQTLTPVFSLGSQLDLFSFVVYAEQTNPGKGIILAVFMFHVCIFFQGPKTTYSYH